MIQKILIAIVLFSSFNLFAQNIPTSGNSSITTCNTTLYDMGGASGGLTANADGSITIYPATAGNVVAVMVQELDIDWYNDYLYIYDGASTSGTLLRTFQGGWGSSNYVDYREYYGTSGAITIRLKTGQYASSSDAGCLIRVRCAPTSQPSNMVRNQQRVISSCNTTIYDHGGIYGDYQNSSTDTILILPDAPNKFVQLTFQHFALNSNDGYDQVFYFGGMKTSPTSTLYANAGYSLPNSGNTMVTARTDGSASFVLQSDAAYTAQGIRVLVSCSTGTTNAISETIIPNTGSTSVTTCGVKVSDNGDKYNYLPNSNGSLTINPATSGKKVQLNFSSFNVSTGDALYVYDGTTTGATLLGTYTGSSIPAAITATSANASGALTVRFTSNGSTESAGFVFNTACVDPLPETLLPTSGSITLTTCDQTIFDNGGVAANYSNNVNGALLITPATSGMKVKLHFNSFATEATNDYLTVYNGNSTAASVIGVYSGTTIPADIVASNASGQLYLTFVSNATVNAAGFNVYASCVIPEAIIPVSGSNTFTTCNGYVYDGGGASGNYADNANGILTLYPEQVGKYVNLDFTSFSLEQFDTLYVYDGETIASNLLGKYTGTTRPAFVRATAANSAGALTLQFKSNGSLNNPGFAALVSCENAVIGTIIPVSGNLSMTTCNALVYDAGGSNGNYGSNIDGSITFYPATTGNMIRATFSSFSTQSSSDILFVYNGTSTSATLLGQYSGASLPPAITAANPDGALTIRFQSNSTINGSGFAISISCALPEVVVPSTGTASVTTCNTTIYDAGGATGNYSINQDGSITVYPATSGMSIRATFNSFNTEGTYDVLSVYNGTTIAATLLGSYSGGSLPPTLTASNASGALTIRFKTDGSVVNSGFAITLTCAAPEIVIPASGNITMTTCSASLFDAGGSAGNYSNSQDGSITIYPATAGNKIRAIFNALSTEANYDYVYVYDGTSTSATLMGQYAGTTLPSSLTATNASGALTIRFKSDISNVSSGFSISVICIDPSEIKIPTSGNTTLTTCSALLYDAGGSTDVYPNSLDGSITIYPSTAGAKVKASILNFATESTYDVLSFYDGTSISATLLNAYSGSSAPSTPIVATETNVSGALTIRFKSDGSINYAGFSVQLSCQVTSVSGISIDPLTASMIIGSTLQLNKTIAPVNATNKNVTWTSSNTSAATVDANGLVTALAAGETNITVTTQDGNFTATSVITVLPVAVTGISVSPMVASVQEGATVQLTATIAPANAANKNVTWSSTNSALATVDANGLVTGVLAGVVDITVTTVDGSFSAVSTITVTPVLVTGISVDPVSASVDVGSTLALSSTISPANASNKNISWTSSNTSVAIVNANGVVTGIADGSVDITVTTEDGNYSAVAVITVNAVSVTGITINPPTVSMVNGSTKQLSAVISPLNATNKNVSWISSNTSVATVDANGLISAVSVGTTEIKVVSADGNLEATSLVEVTPIPVTGISVNPAAAAVVEGNTMQLEATVLPSNAANKNVSWSSSNTAIATVDANGLVTTILSGVVQITATTDDGGFTATSEITVTVNTNITNAGKTDVIFLYPNPAMDKVNLVNLKEGMNIRIVDQTGVEVYSVMHTSDGELDVRALGSGVYSVIVGLGETLYVGKLVIVK